MAKPTRQAYGELQNAYDFFNRELFAAKLPQCLITLQRRRRTCGFFSPSTFKHRTGGQLTDEIALNPAYFVDKPDIETLSTLVHEMVHLWQEHFGKPGRARYHNLEWAKMMEQVGLVPSDTGETGGKRTGDAMSHYIAPDGAFQRAAKRLSASGFTLSWTDRFAERDHAYETTSRNKSKYCCPVCNLNAWAKPEAPLLCGDCEIALVELG